MLPGAQAVLFTNIKNPIDDSEIVALSLDTGEQKVVVTGGFHGRYVQSGHLLYAVGSTLRAIGFDIDTLEPVGGPISMVDGIVTKGSGGADFGVSETGSLVYVRGAGGNTSQGRTLVWVDRDGREIVIPAPVSEYDGPRISPDGRYVALAVGGGNADVMIYDLQRDTSTRFTFEPGRDGYPTWSPDGQRVLFSSDRDGPINIYSKSADGTGQAERLTTSEAFEYPLSWAVDSDVLVTGNQGGAGGFNITVLDAENRTEDLLSTEFAEGVAQVSPDGKWIAYQSNESGVFEVYVRPFPNIDDGKWQISRGTGVEPAWAPNGRELFFRDFGSLAMMVVAVATDPTFSPSNPELLFNAPSYRVAQVTHGVRAWDLSPDGDRFLMIREGDAQSTVASATPIIFVQDWIEELKERLPMP